MAAFFYVLLATALFMSSCKTRGMNSSPRGVLVQKEIEKQRESEELRVAKKNFWTKKRNWRLQAVEPAVEPYAKAESGGGYFVYAIENQSQLIRYNCAGMPPEELFKVKRFETEGRCKKERVPVPVELFFSELKAKIIAMRKSEGNDITKEVEYYRQAKETLGSLAIEILETEESLDYLSGSADGSNIGIASELRVRLESLQHEQTYTEELFRRQMGCEILAFNEEVYGDEFYLSAKEWADTEKSLKDLLSLQFTQNGIATKQGDTNSSIEGLLYFNAIWEKVLPEAEQKWAYWEERRAKEEEILRKVKPREVDAWLRVKKEQMCSLDQKYANVFIMFGWYCTSKNVTNSTPRISVVSLQKNSNIVGLNFPASAEVSLKNSCPDYAPESHHTSLHNITQQIIPAYFNQSSGSEVCNENIVCMNLGGKCFRMQAGKCLVQENQIPPYQFPMGLEDLFRFK